jgi:hypothetical protein
MHFARGFQQQVGQGRMQAFTGNQLHRGANQLGIGFGYVLAQIQPTARQGELVQIADPARIGIRLGKVEKMNVRRVQQLAQQVGGGGIPITNSAST